MPAAAEKGNSPSEKTLKTQGAAADCPSVNLALHLLEAVAETRSTPTDIKQSFHCGGVMASRRADFSYSLHYFWGHKSLILNGRA